MKENNQNNRAGGLILIIVGAFLLAARNVNFEAIPHAEFLFLPALGALFMIAGMLTRDGGWMVPGGILSGIGWGSYLVTAAYSWDDPQQSGGVFLMVFALGWVSITVMSALFAKKTVWGTLVPAAILGAIGAGLYFGGVFLDLLNTAGDLWPLALIIAGAAILVKAFRGQQKAEEATV